MQTDLIQAIKQGDLEKIQQLVAAGANIHYRDDDCYNAFCNALGGANQNLLGTLQLLMAYGVNWSEAQPFYQTRLGDLSRLGCFKVIKFLIEVGIDEYPLQWSPLIKATALGSLQDMQHVLQQLPDLEQRDDWQRTAWLVSLLTGDIEKAKLLQQYGCKTDVRGHCGQPPLFYAIRSHAPAMLQWLIEQGQDVAQECDSGSTCLIEAIDYNEYECANILIAAGIDVDKDACGGPALQQARDAKIIRRLLEANADPKNLSYQGQRALLGYPEITWDEELNIDKQTFEQYHTRTFANSNPELMNNSFWQVMITAGCGAYRLRGLFAESNVDFSKPIWCADRFGQSLTFLPDGRMIQIGGEHEDYYDPDFCIYNDVFVHHAEGKVDIYGYPADIFPPTDFHTATLVGDFIYIIGCLGYVEQSRFGFTPVYRLNIHTFAIEPLKTQGEMPGWISRHRASLLTLNEIQVWGGQIYPNSHDAPVDNGRYFILDLEQLRWKMQGSSKMG